MPEVNININLPEGISILIGDWNASGDTYPVTGGTGSGGSVRKGNKWRVWPTGGNIGPDGEFVAPGTIIEAMVHTPGQTVTNWSRTYAS